MAERFASPAARKLAAELGIAAAAIDGTGRGGSITLADVQRCAPPAAPDGLGEAGGTLWRSFTTEYELGPDGEVLLLAACKTLDEVARLEQKLAAGSLTVTGSRGQVRPHPLLGEVRQHRLALRQLLVSLGAEVEPPADDARARSEAGRKLAAQRWESRRG